MADYGTPITPVEEEKKDNTVWIIVIVLIALFLCCCCLLFVILAWNFGDQVLNEWENLTILTFNLAA